MDHSFNINVAKKLGNEVRVRGKIKSPSRFFFNRRIQDGKRDKGRYE